MDASLVNVVSCSSSELEIGFQPIMGPGRWYNARFGGRVHVVLWGWCLRSPGATVFGELT